MNCSFACFKAWSLKSILLIYWKQTKRDSVHWNKVVVSANSFDFLSESLLSCRNYLPFLVMFSHISKHSFAIFKSKSESAHRNLEVRAKSAAPPRLCSQWLRPSQSRTIKVSQLIFGAPSEPAIIRRRIERTEMGSRRSPLWIQIWSSIVSQMHFSPNSRQSWKQLFAGSKILEKMQCWESRWSCVSNFHCEAKLELFYFSKCWRNRNWCYWHRCSLWSPSVGLLPFGYQQTAKRLDCFKLRK